MTEAEARTKWCPFVRLYGDEWTTRLDMDELKAVASDVSRATKCIASGCMAWRRGEPLPMIEMTNGVKTGEFCQPTGYCGLAGGA